MKNRSLEGHEENMNFNAKIWESEKETIYQENIKHQFK